MESNIKDVDVQRRSSGRLTILYITALSAVALLTILGQFLIQQSIEKQLSDSYVVNMAGKQRYSSQEISKLCLLIRNNIKHNAYPQATIALDTLLLKWKERHFGLLNGSERLNLPATESATVKAMFSETEAYFYEVFTNASLISQEAKQSHRDTARIEKALRKVLDNESLFLAHMNKIVYQYDNEARDKVLFLEKIEFILFVLTIVILIMEGVFIFRPVSKQIKEIISDLIDAEHKAAALTHKVTIANNSLNRSLKDIKGVNLALDAATIMIRTDRYGVITYVNNRFCSIVKYAKEELIGQRLDILSSQFHTQHFFDVMWETISKGNIWNDEIRNKAKDGSYVWLDTTIIPVLNEENIPFQYIAIYTDLSEKFKQSVTEHKIRTSSVLEGQERERRKIARELHDGLGQMLTGLKFTIQGMKPASSKEEQTYIDGIKQMLQDTILEVRRISFDLMPSVLNDFGLAAALMHLSERFSVVAKSKVSIEYVGLKDIGRFDKNTEINIYRIVQEALNNAIKYAEASTIVLDLQIEHGSIIFTVKDNGKGFTPQDKRKTDGTGRGMTNIRERVSLLNGNLIFNSIIDEGTTITVEIPPIIV
jgi:PAS domain S-box-containing protein